MAASPLRFKRLSWARSQSCKSQKLNIKMPWVPSLFWAGRSKNSFWCANFHTKCLIGFKEFKLNKQPLEDWIGFELLSRKDRKIIEENIVVVKLWMIVLLLSCCWVIVIELLAINLAIEIKDFLFKNFSSNFCQSEFLFKN